MYPVFWLSRRSLAMQKYMLFTERIATAITRRWRASFSFDVSSSSSTSLVKQKKKLKKKEIKNETTKIRTSFAALDEAILRFNEPGYMLAIFFAFLLIVYLFHTYQIWVIRWEKGLDCWLIIAPLFTGLIIALRLLTADDYIEKKNKSNDTVPFQLVYFTIHL